MKSHTLRPYLSSEKLAKPDELAYKLATLACSKVQPTPEAVQMVKNRIIDNTAVAIAALNDRPVIIAREMALAHPARNSQRGGSPIIGVDASDSLVSPEWAAWANGTAVRQLDFHDTFLARDYSHPADNIPPLLAVAQSRLLSGEALISAILVAYEVQVALVKAISLHQHAIDHIAHLGVSVAAGLGKLLNLDHEVIYQAIQQALHVTVTTRQSRKGQISSWKAYAPAHAGKLAIEAIDRCMRGEGAPSPIYEGEDSVLAQVLDGKDARYEIFLPEPNEPLLAILETYTKEHSAEYQAQALIDLAFEIKAQLTDLSSIETIVIHTSHHTHKVIGTGSGDPEKFDPHASRETLDHSIMYIFAVALEDGAWHHITSYTPERTNKPSTIALWKKISTCEDPKWTEAYHAPDPKEKAFGGSVVVTLKDGTVHHFEKRIANAHPNGKRPFIYENYAHKFKTLTTDRLTKETQDLFLTTVSRLEDLTSDQLLALNVSIPKATLQSSGTAEKGLFQ
ncbi:2-methylcitrate dehydratase [Spirochaetota bacterium]|nr:2-methylcitrate dehydratase [Spirochaetota bacterium]